MKAFNSSRRKLLSQSLKLGTMVAGGVLARPVLAAGSEDALHSGAKPGFISLPHGRSDKHRISPGYQAEVLLRWGDGLDGKTTTQFPLTAQQQATSFGYNNDFIAYRPLQTVVAGKQASAAKHMRSANSEHGLLCVNHEYTSPDRMFPGFASRAEALQKMSLAQIECDMLACGHSVIEIRKQHGHWQVVPNSHYQRRLSPLTPMEMTGPARGSKRLVTSADPNGELIYGTLGNCAGGTTPWGTVLIAEENFNSFFSGRPLVEDAWEKLSLSHWPTSDAAAWSRLDPRFDLAREPNEINRFGWIVEFNPYDPQSMPKKRSALGRFAHEAATLVCKPGKPAVAYSGDDKAGEFIYRFVSRDNYQAKQDANHDLLGDGTLYCARFDAKGQGEWLPMLFGQGPLVAANGFRNQADVLIDARRAGRLLGATPMDRPEDVETNPLNDRTYVVLTKNTRSKTPNPANPKAINGGGHIIEISPPGVDGNRDHSQLTFSWRLFLLGGDPEASGDHKGVYNPDKKAGKDQWLVNPDNLAFDPQGRMWITTDGAEDFGFNDGVWCTAVAGEYSAIPSQLFSAPNGAELCGPAFTPDGKNLFIAVQHPGESDAEENGQDNYQQALKSWPDFDPRIPARPAIVAISKTDGGLIGGQGSVSPSA